MSDKHTGGKWEVVDSQVKGITKKGNDRFIYITSTEAAPGDICDMYHKSEPGMYYLKTDAIANAKRIVACVNALDGISNEALEATELEFILNKLEPSK